MIVIIDYGMGNVGSIRNMLLWIGAKACISADPEVISQADKLILPGVGAFDNGMRNLNDLGLVTLLTELVIGQKKPLLGICLGMQLLGNRSEEGSLPGLGWIDAETVRFRFDDEHAHLKIPHMGWNSVRLEKESLLFRNSNAEERFYFVHSYHMVCRERGDILTETTYGFDFVSAVERGSILGVQFHPEKSHKFGMKLMQHFVETV
jgi:glutamine amidotransferase